jgi:hypothetical protein
MSTPDYLVLLHLDGKSPFNGYGSQESTLIL